MKIVNLDNESTVYKSFDYRTGINEFIPSAMTIKNVKQTLSWKGRRLVGIVSNIAYEYNVDGMRTKKQLLLEIALRLQSLCMKVTISFNLQKSQMMAKKFLISYMMHQV